MLSDRLAISVLLLPFAMWVMVLGGWIYLLTLLAIFGVAAWEYGQLFQAAGQRPARLLIVGGAALFITAARFPMLNPQGLLFALAIVLPLTWHLIDFERGATTSGTDLAVTVCGIFYLGWLGSYFITLRDLPDGLWWVLATLSSVWLADSGAYGLGRALGRHKMAPRLSPKKTWEGYIGSILGGAAGSAFLSIFWQIGAGADSLLTWQTGLILGALVGFLSPLGDLGVSMLKREIGVKDTGAVLAGHGGMLDRIDSWLVAVAVGYYFVWLLPFIFIKFV